MKMAEKWAIREHLSEEVTFEQRLKGGATRWKNSPGRGEWQVQSPRGRSTGVRVGAWELCEEYVPGTHENSIMVAVGV